MKHAATLALALIASTALASGDCKGRNNCNEGPQTPPTAISSATAESASHVENAVQAEAGVDFSPNLTNSVTFSPEITVEGPESAPNGAGSAPVTLTSEGHDITIGGNTQTYKESARTAVAGYGNTTASCFRTFGLGGSTRSSSWSLGLPLKDGDCELGEDAALAFMMGNDLAAWRLYCAQGNVRKVYGFKRWSRAKDKTTREEASDACMGEAGVWMAVRESNAALEAVKAKFEALDLQNEQLRAALAEHQSRLAELADLSAELAEQAHPPAGPAPAAPEPAPIRYEAAGLTGPGGEVATKEAEKCPPDDPTIAAAICDGVPTLNPNRLRPPPPDSD